MNLALAISNNQLISILGPPSNSWNFINFSFLNVTSNSTTIEYPIRKLNTIPWIPCLYVEPKLIHSSHDHITFTDNENYLSLTGCIENRINFLEFKSNFLIWPLGHPSQPEYLASVQGIITGNKGDVSINLSSEFMAYQTCVGRAKQCVLLL